MSRTVHVPVMLEQVTRCMGLSTRRPALRLLDATLGEGGYTSHFLSAFPQFTVVGVDRDASQKATVDALHQRFGSRFVGLVPTRWSQMMLPERAAQIGKVDGVVMDLGMCKSQMDAADRGFSFRVSRDAPLDMRMDGPAATDLPTAAHLLNTMTHDELFDLFFVLGEQPMARARVLATRVIKGRPWSTVGPFVDMLRTERTALVPKAIDPATLPFQALRMTVNREVEELIAGLVASQHLLRPGGKLVVVSYQSLEDRIVKKFLRFCIKPTAAGLPEGTEPTFAGSVDLLKRPEDDEIAANPRSSSALLRTAERTPAPSVDIEAVLNAVAVKRRINTIT